MLEAPLIQRVWYRFVSRDGGRAFSLLQQFNKCCSRQEKKNNLQLLYVKSLRKGTASYFRDVIETQVQRFQGNVGLQLTRIDAPDPVVMSETDGMRIGEVCQKGGGKKDRTRDFSTCQPACHAGNLLDFSSDCPIKIPRCQRHAHGPCSAPKANQTVFNHKFRQSLNLSFLVWRQQLLLFV